MRIQKTKSSLPIRLLVISIAVILTGWLSIAYLKSYWPFSESAQVAGSEDAEDSIDYSGPTEQEIEDSQDAKKRASEEQDSAQQEQPETKAVDVGISYAAINDGKLEVRAFVPSVIEGTGTCTATATNGEKSVSASSKAFIDISSSICEPIYIDQAQLSSGTWSVTVTYSSPTATGTSDIAEVTI